MPRSSRFVSTAVRLAALGLFALALVQPLVHTRHHADSECSVCHLARNGAQGILWERGPCPPVWSAGVVHVDAAENGEDQLDTRLHAARAPPTDL